VFSEKMQSETSVERTKSKSILKPEEFFEKRKQQTCQVHFLHTHFLSMREISLCGACCQTGNHKQSRTIALPAINCCARMRAQKWNGNARKWKSEIKYTKCKQFANCN